MRLLKVVVKGAGLFVNDTFSMDFYAADRVAGKEGPAYNHVHRLEETSNIYSQNVVGISGVNASGKSTTLKVIQLALDLIYAPYFMRRGYSKRYLPAKMRKGLVSQVVFWQGGSYYLLESEISVSRLADEGDSPNWFRIDDETLWRLTAARPNKAMIGDPDKFKSNAEVYLRRNQGAGDGKSVPLEARRFLRGNISIAVALSMSEEGGEQFDPDDILRTSHATAIVHAFDSSVELLEWDAAADAFRLQFHGEEERMVSSETVLDMLSDGTVVGIGLVERALVQLLTGGYMLIDEIEAGLNKSLVKSIIELFQSHASNPNGAQLIFTTHYIELLDYLPRKDDVYLLVRDGEFNTEVIKYSDRISRIENKKSEMVLANVIKGVMPSYPEIEGMRAYAREFVREK